MISRERMLEENQKGILVVLGPVEDMILGSMLRGIRMQIPMTTGGMMIIAGITGMLMRIIGIIRCHLGLVENQGTVVTLMTQKVREYLMKTEIIGEMLTITLKKKLIFQSIRTRIRKENLIKTMTEISVPHD